MSLEMYGPPERAAQGRGLMKREKEGPADSSRTESTKKGVREGLRERGGRKRGNWEREQEERCWQSWRKWSDDMEGWTTAASGETNGPAWRDSAQSIIFKQKQPAQENI